MKRSTKIWLIILLFVIAGIIAFAIYKGLGTSKDTTVTTTGGTTIKSTNGIGSLLLTIFGI